MIIECRTVETELLSDKRRRNKSEINEWPKVGDARVELLFDQKRYKLDKNVIFRKIDFCTFWFKNAF